LSFPFFIHPAVQTTGKPADPVSAYTAAVPDQIESHLFKMSADFSYTAIIIDNKLRQIVMIRGISTRLSAGTGTDGVYGNRNYGIPEL
jgi:hypothetical protein